MKNDSKSQSELQKAITAGENNNIMEWVLEFLQSHERNAVVVNDIQKREIAKMHLVEFPLHLLQGTVGRQNGEAHTESLSNWLERVKMIEDKIESNEMPPPIIVTDFWQKLHVVDGNHRREALLKRGFKSYWTIFLLEKHETSTMVLEAIKTYES